MADNNIKQWTDTSRVETADLQRWEDGVNKADCLEKQIPEMIAAHNTADGTHDDIRALANEKANSLVFDTKEQLDSWVAGTYTRSDGKTTADLKVGDNLYIVELGVPDYWWDGSVAVEMESKSVQKADQTYSPSSENAQSGKAVAEAVKTLIGTNIGNPAADTIWGAKNYADAVAGNAKYTLIGSDSDTGDSDTIKGAKKYTDGEIETVNSSISNINTHLEFINNDLSTKQDKLEFNTAYDASTNKVATMADMPIIDQSYDPESANAQSGIAIAEAIRPVRQTITIDTPVWETQPTIEGVLSDDFKTWESGKYYMTLKDADGNALESGQFKLTTTLNGYASAIDQIFTSNGSDITLTENFPVDFKSISSDRLSFEMRDAGVTWIDIKTNNPKSQRYIFSVYHYLMLKNVGTKYIYLADSVGFKLGPNALYYSTVGVYNGYNGFLMPICNSNVTNTCILGYTIEANRTKKGFVDSMTGLRVFNSKREAISNYFFSDLSIKIDDFHNEDVSSFKFYSNSQYYFCNGTVITLEEFA